MRIVKRLISIITAIVISSAVCSLTAFALNYRDPNEDGVITIADNIYIRQYLTGLLTPSYREKMDVNENGLVSLLDANMITVIDSGGSFIKGNAGSVITNTNLYDYNTREYYVYNAQTGQRLTNRDYSLSPSTPSNSIGGGDSPDSVIGTDDRVIDWTKSGVVKLMCSTNPYYRGTGFVVGKHLIATAAHCVHDGSTSAKTLSGIKLFNANGTVALTATPVEIHVPKNYITVGCNYDYALITVEEDLTSYMCFDMGVIMDYNSNVPITVTATGFPQTLPNIPNSSNDGNNHYMYSGTGSVTGTTTRRVSYNADTSDGESGCPIYVSESSNGYVHYSVIAIHTNGGDTNSGVRINSDILRFIFQNNNLNW